MKIRFTEYPSPLDEEQYRVSIRGMTEKLMQTGLVKCIFQVGGVSAPGISDVDLYVIFKNGVNYGENPIEGLPFPGNYIFSHKLFGATEDIATRQEQYTHFGKYLLVAGEEVNMFRYPRPEEEVKTVKYQVAFEYLAKAWITINSALMTGTVKVRSFLLHARAVQYDMEFLQIRDNELRQCVHEVIEMRNNWFHKKPTYPELSKLVIRYRDTLNRAISDTLLRVPFYIPGKGKIKISNRMELVNGSAPSILRNGIRLPNELTARSKFFFKVQNRLNNFEIQFPMERADIPPILHERFEFFRNAFRFNREHLPWFICTGHGLNIFES